MIAIHIHNREELGGAVVTNYSGLERRRKRRLKLLLALKKVESVSSEEIADVLLYLYERESVILGVTLEELARSRLNFPAQRKAVQLLRLAMEPPEFVPKDLLREVLATLSSMLPREDILFAIDLVTGVVTENQHGPYAEQHRTRN